MFKNRITVCMYTQNPEKDNIFQKLESFFHVLWCNRCLDWSIIRDDNKILQYTELSDQNWNQTLEFWQLFASAFIYYDVEVKYELSAKEIVIDMNADDSSICIIINFNI